MQVDTGAFEGLAAQVADLTARVAAAEAQQDRYTQILEILRDADQQPAFSQRKPRRDRHGLRLAPGGKR
jgi:hypothetical protein